MTQNRRKHYVEYFSRTGTAVAHADIPLPGLEAYLLQGAVQCVRWHDLPQNTRDELKGFFHSLNN
jgi:hypothetical protein